MTVTADTQAGGVRNSRWQPLSPLAARMLTRARKEWQLREYEAAERSANNVLALAPHNPDAIRTLGMVVQRRGDHVRAAECFREVLAAWPADPDLRIVLGIALCECGQADEAVEHLRYASELAPTSASAWFNLGEALGRGARAEESLAPLQRALELAPTHVSARLSLARVRANTGDIDAAVGEFREVLRHDPYNAEAWFGLSNLNTVLLDAEDAASIQRALARPCLSPRDYELLGFSRAKALENQGDYAEAFETFRLANASRRKRVHWDAKQERARIQSIRHAFDQPVPVPLDARLGREVILIASIPRSGSTLVEQILASHSEVEGANEIREMRDRIDEESRRRNLPFPEWVGDAAPADWQRLGREYLARTARWRECKPRFTDKSLVTWPLAGAALAMLPAARVVIVRRDPVETCLGCFRQCFSEASAFACDLDDIADYCIDFLHLARFWIDRYPTRVFDLEYEKLVAEPELVIRQLLDFCELPFEPACLEPHKAARLVRSLPSAAQVRQPLHQNTARSALYGDKLDRLRRRLRDARLITQSASAGLKVSRAPHVHGCW